MVSMPVDAHFVESKSISLRNQAFTLKCPVAGKMSEMGILQQLTSKASCKSLSLIDLPYLPAEKLRIARMYRFN